MADRSTAQLSLVTSSTRIVVGVANTATSISPIPPAGVSWAIDVIGWSYSAAPTGGRLTLSDSNNGTILDIDIIAGGPGFWPVPKKGSVNGTWTFTLAAGGAAIVGKLDLTHLWSE